MKRSEREPDPEAMARVREHALRLLQRLKLALQELCIEKVALPLKKTLVN